MSDTANAPSTNAGADEFGRRARERRTQLGLSLRAAAARARMQHGYLGEIERGDRSPSLTTVMRIAHALDTTASELLAGMCWSPPRAVSSVD